MCFFQLHLPNYPSRELLAKRLKYAIQNCHSTDTDNYMLRRVTADPVISYSDNDDW